MENPSSNIILLALPWPKNSIDGTANLINSSLEMYGETKRNVLIEHRSTTSWWTFTVSVLHDGLLRKKFSDRSCLIILLYYIYVHPQDIMVQSVWLLKCKASKEENSKNSTEILIYKNRITGGHGTDAVYGWTLDPSQCLTPFWDKEDCRLGGEKRQDKQEIMNKHMPSVLRVRVGLTSR